MIPQSEKEFMERLATGSEYLLKLDRATGAANVIELEPSWMSRTVQAVRYIVSGKKATDWFGPGAPIAPTAPQQLEGRQFDYPVTFNTNMLPKQGEMNGLPNVPFSVLRRIADNCDILRLLIETRKAQVQKLDWGIVPRQRGVKPDKRCAELEGFFMLPDKEHTWDEWIGMLLEDMLVVDAATVYPRLARSGELYSLEPVDGTTIKRILDDYGRTPVGDDVPAYQQYLKGVPAFDYTRDQLVYRPRNLRTNRVYGYSVVEQIIVTIQLALNRTVYQMQYYTEGSTPDLILKVPEGWTPKQIKEFKAEWDGMLTGVNGQRRGTMFVYNGTDVVNTKESILTDKFDEWLARICCFAFGMSPQPFVQLMNRATADTAKESASEDGTAPVLRWIKNLIDYVLTKHFGAAAYEFQWKTQQAVDAKTQAEIDDKRLRNGSKCVNEIRAREGEDPLPGGNVPMIYTATGGVPLALAATGQLQAMAAMNPQIGPPGSGGDGDEDGSKPKPQQNPMASSFTMPQLEFVPVPSGQEQESGTGPSADFEKLTKAIDPDNLRAAIMAALSGLPEIIAAQVTSGFGKAVGSSNIDAILSSLDLSAIANIRGSLTLTISTEYGEAYKGNLTRVGVQPSSSLFDLFPARAADYAAARAAELISSGPNGGELGDATRLFIRADIVDALEAGLTQDELAALLRANYAFSEARADTIAQFEIRAALHGGALAAWKESGLVKGKGWLLSNDEGVCAVCQANAEQGEIDLDEEFQSGDETSPAHPHCRCDVYPVVAIGDDADNDE